MLGCRHYNRTVTLAKTQTGGMLVRQKRTSARMPRTVLNSWVLRGREITRVFALPVHAGLTRRSTHYPKKGSSTSCRRRGTTTPCESQPDKEHSPKSSPRLNCVRNMPGRRATWLEDDTCRRLGELRAEREQGFRVGRRAHRSVDIRLGAQGKLRLHVIGKELGICSQSCLPPPRPPGSNLALWTQMAVQALLTMRTP